MTNNPSGLVTQKDSESTKLATTFNEASGFVKKVSDLQKFNQYSQPRIGPSIRVTQRLQSGKDPIFENQSRNTLIEPNLNFLDRHSIYTSEIAKISDNNSQQTRPQELDESTTKIGSQNTKPRIELLGSNQDALAYFVSPQSANSNQIVNIEKSFKPLDMRKTPT